MDTDLLEYYLLIGWSSSHPGRVGVDTRYKPPITQTYRGRCKKKKAQPVALWMEPLIFEPKDLHPII
jgi:hypothetical protein